MKINREIEIARQGRKLLWPKPGEGYFSWVKDNWTTRGESLDFEKHKYLIDLYKDQHHFIAMMKSAQTGATERGITEAIWLPDQYSENSIYIFPTSGAISDMVQERVDPPLSSRKYLREVTGRIKRLIGKNADKIGLKRMSKGFVYFRGSNKPTQITSVAGDAIFVDEVDRMLPESIPYYEKRLAHSKRKWQRWYSTPTIPDFGIHKIFLQTDQRHRYLKCVHCGEWQILSFFENVDFKMANPMLCEEAHLVCKKCRQQIVPWACDGEWKTHVDGTDKHGYFLSSLYSPFVDLRKMVEASQRPAEFEIQQFYNQDLGLPYEPKGGRITEEMIHSCIRDYRSGIKEADNYMGVDVGRVLHTIILNSKGKVAYYGSPKDFETLDNLMKEYNIKKCVIDALPETRKAQEFADRFRGRVMICYYSGISEPKKGEWFRAEGQKVNTDRTLSLDMYTARYKNQNIYLPSDIDGSQEFKDHMKALVRIVRENKSGQFVAEYMQTGADHFYHAGNYANLAEAIFTAKGVPEVFTL